MAHRCAYAAAVLLVVWACVPELAQGQKLHADDCILYGNVFTPDGHLFQGAEVNVRRAKDKHPKWETSSDRRGEFAVRVPPGPDYVIEVKAKGWETQTQTVASQTGRMNLVFHMVEKQRKKD